MLEVIEEKANNKPSRRKLKRKIWNVNTISITT